MITQNPIFGSSRKKLGGVVATRWKGINVLKGKPLTVANPKSDGQMFQRNQMSLAVSIFRRISNVIDLGFLEQAVQKSAYNAFVGTNLKAGAFKISDSVVGLQASNMSVSKGSISQQEIATQVIHSATNTLNLAWNYSANQPGQSATDKIIIAIYSNDKNMWFTATPSIQRDQELAGVVFPSGSFETGDECFVWVGFYNPKTRKSSDSLYYDVTVVV